MIRRWRALLALFCCASCAPTPAPGPKLERWAVYYDHTLPSSAFTEYDLVVFDRQHHPKLAPLLDRDITVLAYVSGGEIAQDAPFLTKLKGSGAILAHNATWDSHVVDLTYAAWRSRVLEQVADAEAKGFSGIMLDTLDSPLHYAAEKGKELGEANRLAAIQLVRDIRTTYPAMKLMMNRGLAILPEVSEQLDFILAESVLAETNVSTGQSRLFSPNTYRQVVAQLHAAQRQSPQLKIYTLDYWNKDDVDGIQLLYALQRAHGFAPYVTSPDLRQLSPEPHSKQARRYEPIEPIATEFEDNDA